MDYHIGSKGTEVTFPAGYMNRAMRRRMAKINAKIARAK